MVKISERHPAPHARYVVQRGEIVFTATPCYGMHSPWWVQKVADGSELPPIAFEDDDDWMPSGSSIYAALVAARDALPDNVDDEDESWGWAWDEMSELAQQTVKAARGLINAALGETALREEQAKEPPGER